MGQRNRLTWLKKLREEKGLTQMDVAKLCGTSSKNISKIETGSGLPSLELAYKMSVVLGFDMDMFTKHMHTEKDKNCV